MVWQKRHAIQIASQLPDDPQDALAVLAYAKVLVEQFLCTTGPQPASVVPFKVLDAASNR